MSKEFKVGDRVKVVKKGAPGFEAAVIGDTGTIEKLHVFKRCWLVKFDKERPDVYNTNLGRFDREVGYWCTPDMLQDLSTDEKIIITTDGVTTTARRYIGKELQGTAEAKCSPSDTFDFEKGANLAFGRLVGWGADEDAKEPTQPEPKFIVGDLVRVTGCSRPVHGLTVGSLAVVKSVSTYSTSYGGYTYALDGSNCSGRLLQRVSESDIEPYMNEKE